LRRKEWKDNFNFFEIFYLLTSRNSSVEHLRAENKNDADLRI
jgi:hypothetical protein